MRRKLELTKDKNELIKIAMDCMQMEMDRQMTEHNDYVKRLTESHNKKLSETKKKQWVRIQNDVIFSLITFMYNSFIILF